MQYVIVANGDFLSTNLLQAITAGKHIVALDNAATRLLSLDMIPHTIIGDGDSLSPSALQQFNADDAYTLIIDPDQHTTDLQKALTYCDQQHATIIEIVCALGDRLDHSLFNLRLLRQYYRSERRILLHTQRQTIMFIKDEKIDIMGNIGNPCGLFAFPKATFTSNGLAYDGNAYALEFALTDSVANYLTKPQAAIDIRGEALLIAPGYYRQQHDKGVI